MNEIEINIIAEVRTMLSRKVVEMLNNQVNAEFYSAYLT